MVGHAGDIVLDAEGWTFSDHVAERLVDPKILGFGPLGFEGFLQIAAGVHVAHGRLTNGRSGIGISGLSDLVRGGER